jgi:hypothetical protein
MNEEEKIRYEQWIKFQMERIESLVDENALLKEDIKRKDETIETLFNKIEIFCQEA